jgi:glyoxylase I family protein
MNTPNGPVITGVHHVCLTVTDLDTSMNWYQQLFQAEWWPGRLPHYAREETGFAEMLVEPHTAATTGEPRTTCEPCGQLPAAGRWPHA